MKVFIRVASVISLLWLSGCRSSPTVLPPQATAMSVETDRCAQPNLSVQYDPTNEDIFQIDFRSRDLSRYNLREATDILLYSHFSTETQWPEPDCLPDGFDPQSILELGKDPGLGVRSLHLRGITGKGVSIAIIDMKLLRDHTEYADRIVFYEEIGIDYDGPSMHGPGVASIAAGKSTGVAPEANIYFIAANIVSIDEAGQVQRDFTDFARAVRRIVEINRTLPAEEKIRALSLSVGWRSTEPGYSEMASAVEAAKKDGIFVVSSNLDATYPGFRFNGLGRYPTDDPNEISSYSLGESWTQFSHPYPWPSFQDQIFIPMDSRTIASYLGVEEYNWGRFGGWSWCIPYIAGLYALGVQVDPDLTPEIFWQAMTNTAHPFSVELQGQEFPTKIVQPVRLIEDLAN